MRFSSRQVCCRRFLVMLNSISTLHIIHVRLYNVCVCERCTQVGKIPLFSFISLGLLLLRSVLFKSSVTRQQLSLSLPFLI